METRRYRLPRDRGRRRAIRLRIRALVDKDAGAERVRWNNAGGSRCHRFPALFVIQEEVQAVFPDWASKRSATDVALVFSALHGRADRVVEERVGRRAHRAVVPSRVSMKLIRTV